MASRYNCRCIYVQNAITKNPISVVCYRLYKYLIMKGDTNGWKISL